MIKMFSIFNKNKICSNYNLMYYSLFNNRDLMNYIEEDDRRILTNKRLLKMSPGDWGMSVGISNEYIQANLLRTIYPEIYTEPNDIRNKGFDTGINIRGYDFIFKNDNKFNKVQCKLRQTKGIDIYSCQVSITTSRRSSNSKDVPYQKDDFDYLFVSLVNVKDNYDNRSDINKWGFSLIPVEDLIDKENPNYLIRNVSGELLNKYKLQFI